jgi:hypothetical protein
MLHPASNFGGVPDAYFAAKFKSGREVTALDIVEKGGVVLDDAAPLQVGVADVNRECR